LSKNQSRKLGVLLAVISNESLPSEHLQQSLDCGFIVFHDGKYLLTPEGIDEKNRLCTLAGLNIRLSSEKKPQSLDRG